MVWIVFKNDGTTIDSVWTTESAATARVTNAGLSGGLSKRAVATNQVL